MSRSKTKLQAVVAEIEKLGAQGYAVAGDLTKGSDCQSAVEEAVSFTYSFILTTNIAILDSLGSMCLLR